MRILSKTKDYYDSIGFKYGQDPDITYLRGPLPDNKLSIDWKKTGGISSPWNLRYGFSHQLVWNRPYPWSRADVHFIVAGTQVVPFLCWLPLKKYVLLTETHDFLFSSWNHVDRPTLPSKEDLLYLIKEVGAPVFEVYGIGSDSCLNIAKNIPNLGELGFAKIVPAQQMWQNIYDCLTNVLRKNPDKEPPLTIGNDDRIEAAGFDLKSSFRHPVNLKKVR